MPKKVQVVSLVDPGVRDRLDALRIVTGESRARVGELAWLGGGLEAIELDPINASGLATVRRLAERADMEWEQYVRAYARAYGRVAYGPGLKALVEDDRKVTLNKRKPEPLESARAA